MGEYEGTYQRMYYKVYFGLWSDINTYQHSSSSTAWGIVLQWENISKLVFSSLITYINYVREYLNHVREYIRQYVYYKLYFQLWSHINIHHHLAMRECIRSCTFIFDYISTSSCNEIIWGNISGKRSCTFFFDHIHQHSSSLTAIHQVLVLGEWMSRVIWSVGHQNHKCDNLSPPMSISKWNWNWNIWLIQSFSVIRLLWAIEN